MLLPIILNQYYNRSSSVIAIRVVRILADTARKKQFDSCQICFDTYILTAKIIKSASIVFSEDFTVVRNILAIAAIKIEKILVLTALMTVKDRCKNSKTVLIVCRQQILDCGTPQLNCTIASLVI